MPRYALAAPRDLPTDDFSFETDAFYNDLDARQRSPRTKQFYREALEQFGSFLATTGRSLDPTAWITRDFLDFYDHLRSTPDARGRNRSEATVAARHRGLRAFCGFLVRKEVVPKSPMLGMAQPVPDTQDPRVSTRDELDALLVTCRGKAFLDVRDRTIISLLIDCGLRLGEVATIRVEDLDLRGGEVAVVGKTGARHAPFGATTRACLEDYLRARRRHRNNASPYLWIGERGRSRSHLHPKSISHMIVARGARVGLDLHPHLLRHTWVHEYLSGDPKNGIEPGNPVDLMRLAGWRDLTMTAVYARSTGARRARADYKRRSLMDRIGR